MENDLSQPLSNGHLQNQAEIDPKIEKILPELTSQLSRLLIPFEWQPAPNGNERYFAQSVFGRYEIIKWTEESWGMVAPNEQINATPKTLCEAQDLAFENYTSRIRMLFKNDQ